MVGRFCSDDPRFGDFNPIGCLFYTSTQSDWPRFCRKKGLSLSHLIPEILGLKVGLIFHKNVFFKRFLSILYLFSFNFRSNWPLFSLILKLFDPSFSQKLISEGSNFFLRVLHPTTENLMKHPLYHPRDVQCSIMLNVPNFVNFSFSPFLLDAAIWLFVTVASNNSNSSVWRRFSRSLQPFFSFFCILYSLNLWNIHMICHKKILKMSSYQGRVWLR